MELSTDELRDVYDVMVRPQGHPDGIGFMARALLLSGGDPDHIDINGKQGFIPLDPDATLATIGVMDVQSLEGNVSAAIAMDIQNMQAVRSVEDMIVATHDGINRVGNPTKETQAVLDDLDEAREEVQDMLFPRLATVEDVIKLLRASETATPSKTRMKFFKELINGQS